MQNYGYESPSLKISFLVDEIVRTSENVMPDPYSFGTDNESPQIEGSQFGQ